jgi:hypothetical protein
MRKSICIIALSPIAKDARVLRQIRYLSPLFDLTVIGYGPPHPEFADSPAIRWVQLDKQEQPAIPRFITALKNRDITTSSSGNALSIRSRTSSIEACY